LKYRQDRASEDFVIFSILLEKHGVCLLVGREDMTLDEVIRVHDEAFRSARAAGWEKVPVFFDLRGVDLMRFDSAGLKRLIEARKALGQETLGNRFASVVSCDGCYGMMRMYNTLAEVQGLRPASLSFVSRDMREAVSWLARDMPGVSAEAVCRDLEAAADQLGATSA
jgi:hypothetical protein